ncbi:tRNA (32-2'-O)-methyltransferase regulator THADA-like [Ptychodera flava]|uniref:tRNA (32-2'-O)-methyltransferase regulator THADA-like n=1 Tax=Ptychodera flava TaxID=63121 RepID=UPI003969C2F8
MDQEVRVEVTKMLDVSICSGQSDLINQLDSHLHEFLRATNIKHQQMAMDTIVREMSKLQIITDDKEEELKAWDMFISVICKIYANSKESTKISKTILKVVKQLYRLFPDRTQTMFDEEVTSLWFGKQETLSNGTLQRVSIMIDECELMKKFLENNLRVFTASLSRIMMGYCICSDVVDVASCQVSTKICLQTIQLHPHIGEKIIWKDSEDEMKDHTKDIITCLLMIIFSKRFSRECSLLAGSAVGLLINTSPSQEDAMATAVNLLKLTTEVTPERRLEFGKLSVSFGVDDSISNHAFPTLVLLKAMLTCLDKELLVADVMLEGKKMRFLFDVLFPEVCKVCKNVTKVQFHSFQVLMLWLQCVRNSIHQVYRDQNHPSRVFTKDCKYTTTVLQLVWENWENPIDGVVDCIKASFSELLEIYSEESRLCKEVDNTFYDDLSVRLVNTPWHVKGKYGPLCSLISYIGAAKFLTAHPEVASSLVSCLATNYLAPPACEVYKTFLQNLRKECSASSEDSLAEYWSLFWKSHLLAALCHETQLLRHNASHYWLPWTLKIFPAAHEMLITELSNHSEMFSPTRCLHAQIGVLNVARNLKIINGCDLQPEPICQALWHLDDDVRSDAVGLLCNSHKKSEPLSELECRLLKEFLPINLNCDSSPFRQHLYAYMKRLVVRIRDSCIATLKQNLKEKKGRQPPSVDSSTPRTVEMSVDFVDWLFDLSVSSLFPGSCYQRRKTSLELILAILESLITGDGIARRKGQTPDSAGLLMDWANGCKKWMFFSQRNASLILSCMEDGTNEIRELAYSILAVYFPWPLVCLTTECPKYTARHILQQSYHLLCSPKAMESESGAIMCKLVFQKYVAEMGWKFTMKLHSPEEISIAVDTKPTEGDSRLCFVKELQEQLMQQYEAAKRNLLKAATTSPLHGILLALRRCLTENNITTAMTTNENSDDLKSVIGQILETVETIVNAMLQVLFGKVQIQTLTYHQTLPRWGLLSAR